MFGPGLPPASAFYFEIDEAPNQSHTGAVRPRPQGEPWLRRRRSVSRAFAPTSRKQTPTATSSPRPGGSSSPERRPRERVAIRRGQLARPRAHRRDTASAPRSHRASFGKAILSRAGRFREPRSRLSSGPTRTKGRFGPGQSHFNPRGCSARDGCTPIRPAADRASSLPRRSDAPRSAVAWTRRSGLHALRGLEPTGAELARHSLRRQQGRYHTGTTPLERLTEFTARTTAWLCGNG